MTIFLILAPYGAFATLMLVTSAAVSLFAAAAICLMVIAFDVVRARSRQCSKVGSTSDGYVRHLWLLRLTS